MIEDRRGELTEKVTNIIIAVVCLALLAILVVVAYNQLSQTEYKSAKSTLDSIIRKVNSIKPGESTEFTLQSFCKGKTSAECGWRIFAWGDNGYFISGQENIAKPDRCYFNSCICICKSNEKSATSNCQSSETGLCEKINIKNIEVKTVDYRGQGDLSSIEIGGRSLVGLKMSKQGESLSIIRESTLEDDKGTDMGVPVA